MMAKMTDTKFSRRKMMLVTGGAVAGASALMAASFRDEITIGVRTTVKNIPGVSSLLSLADATYDEWLGVVGSTFSLGGGTNMQLVGVRALPSSGDKPEGVREQGFAAFFDPAKRASVAPDLIYTATTSHYGPTQLYLAATSDPRTPGRMVAVFN